MNDKGFLWLCGPDHHRRCRFHHYPYICHLRSEITTTTKSDHVIRLCPSTSSPLQPPPFSSFPASSFCFSSSSFSPSCSTSSFSSLLILPPPSFPQHPPPPLPFLPSSSSSFFFLLLLLPPSFSLPPSPTLLLSLLLPYLLFICRLRASLVLTSSEPVCLFSAHHNHSTFNEELTRS